VLLKLGVELNFFSGVPFDESELLETMRVTNDAEANAVYIRLTDIRASVRNENVVWNPPEGTRALPRRVRRRRTPTYVEETGESGLRMSPVDVFNLALGHAHKPLRQILKSFEL
jgi:hypothetical protein